MYMYLWFLNATTNYSQYTSLPLTYMAMLLAVLPLVVVFERISPD